jgi:hypothetical protein
MLMKNIKSLLILGTLSFITIGKTNAQYISNVSIPDSSTEIPQDEIYRLSQSISAEDLKSHLYTLASDSFGGRELGAPGNTMAAEYISNHFKSLGLKSLDGSDDYFQQVDFSWLLWDDISIQIRGERYKQLWDFVAFQDQNTGSTLKETEVVFMGYGIESESYNDYRKVKDKAQDKVIIIYSGEPIDKDGKYRVTASSTPSEWSSNIDLKLETAQKYGAKHVLIIADNIQKLVEKNRRQLLGAQVILGKPGPTATLDYTYISSTMAKALIGDEVDKVIKKKECIRKRGKFKPMVIETDLELTQIKKVRELSGVNVAAMIEGSEMKDEYVFLTAHYDHIGQKGKDINNGADDNASGTSTVLEIAEAFALASEEGQRPKRSIVFMLVTGEEKGLLGSNYYVENPILPLEQTIVDINIDMVGRIDKKYEGRPNYIYVIGSDRISMDLHRVNESVNHKYSKLILDYKYNDEKDPNRFYFRSDHYNFAKKGIPSIFFFNGTHEDYHRPTDTADKIEYEKMSQIGRHIFRLAWALGDRDLPLQKS